MPLTQAGHQRLRQLANALSEAIAGEGVAEGQDVNVGSCLDDALAHYGVPTDAEHLQSCPSAV